MMMILIMMTRMMMTLHLVATLTQAWSGSKASEDTVGSMPSQTDMVMMIVMMVMMAMVRIAKCQIFYTDQYRQTRFYPNWPIFLHG